MPTPVLAGLVLGMAGCAVTSDTVDVTMRVDRRLAGLLAAGGATCAPRELALARANLAFARDELEQGDPSRAAEHAAEAELQARAAEHMASPERCAASPAPPPAVRVPNEALDTDGDGVPDGLDACLRAREDLDGFADTDGCPDLDNDGDRIPDLTDRCPNQPEDHDGDRDFDGCPDAIADRDADGVADADDACPDTPGSAANQGCMRGKYAGIEITPQSIRVAGSIMFEDGTATLDASSYPILDAVAQAMNEHSRITLEVQGHTDSRGETAPNQRLSQARAEAVVRYLVDRGVGAQRLTPKGYGETRPIESNRTSQGRAINRRVELVRTDGGS